MSLRTFEITYNTPDRTGVYLRLLSSTIESCFIWLLKNRPDVTEVTTIKEEPKEATYCECCGTKLSANYI